MGFEFDLVGLSLDNSRGLGTGNRAPRFDGFMDRSRDLVFRVAKYHKPGIKQVDSYSSSGSAGFMIVKLNRIKSGANNMLES